MQDKEIKAKLEELQTNVNEIMASITAVKGGAFADVVAVTHESAQIIEVINKLSSMIDEEHAEYVSAITSGCRSLLASIISKFCQELSDSDIEEAMSVARTLSDRRVSAVQAIRKGFNEDGNLH